MLDKLHPELLSSIGDLPDDKPVAFLTRHSIRGEPQNGFASYDIPLTEEGVELAQALGQKLTRPLHKVFSSPSPRCVDTATAILKGACHEMDVEKTKLLVEPGSYVVEIEKVAGLFFKLGPLKFAQKHLRGEVRGVLQPKEGTQKLLMHLKDAMGPDGSLSLHVTHDTILTAFVYSLLDRSSLTDDHWPWMMEGVFVWFDGDAVNWIWRGKQYRLDNFS